VVTSIAGLACCGILTSAPAHDLATPLAQAALAASAQAGTDLSAQRRVNVGRVGRAGGNVGRVGRVGNVGRVGRVGRIGQVGRVGRVGRIGYEGRIGRVGRVGYRYGRVGRVGYIPVPVPVPIGPGPGAPPRVMGPTCAVCPVQACLVAVYSDPNLTGQAFETADNQPRLDLNRWQNQTASVIVKSGTWDFYPELEFRGQPLRLAAGSYPILEPQWTKRIGSFMCVR
jgi:hypothetical protein